MTDHTKPQTLNPIPVGTRVMIVKTFFFPQMLGATGIVVGPYALRPCSLGLRWAYEADFDHFPSNGHWPTMHGQIVPIAPPDEVVIDEQIEVTA